MKSHTKIFLFTTLMIKYIYDDQRFEIRKN